MIIDIDIKISDSDGNVLHRYEERFDENTACGERLNYNATLGKSFEDFLSEYMSFSGRAVREKLISDYYPAPAYPSDLYPGEINNTANAEMGSCPEGNEMEYRIRIGRKNILTGKIPLGQLSYSHTAGDADSASNDAVAASKNGECGDTAIDAIIDYAMCRAIRKYEANLSPPSEEEFEYGEADDAE